MYAYMSRVKLEVKLGFENPFQMPAKPKISGLGNWRVNAFWRKAIIMEGLYLKCHLIPMSPILPNVEMLICPVFSPLCSEMWQQHWQGNTLSQAITFVPADRLYKCGRPPRHAKMKPRIHRSLSRDETFRITRLFREVYAFVKLSRLLSAFITV